MRNLKKVLSLALALVMLLGLMMVGAGAATTEVSAKHEEAASVLGAINVVTGDGSGDINPAGNLTRADATLLIARIKWGLSVAEVLKANRDETQFTDVPKTHYASGTIAYLVDLDIVHGTSATTFNPNGNITDTDFAQLVMQTLGIEGDFGTGNRQAKVAMALQTESLNENVALTGRPISREMAFQLMFNALQWSPSGNQWAVGDMVFDTMQDAAMYAAMMNIGKVPGDAGYVLRLGAAANKNDTLAVINFGLTEGTATDNFGRTVKTWNVDSATDPIYVAETASTAPVVTYNKKGVKADDVKKATGASSSEVDDTLIYVNGVAKATTGSSKTAIESLCENGTTVEVYAFNKAVTKVVVVTPTVYTVTKVDEKKDTFTVGGIVIDEKSDFAGLIGTVAKDDPMVGVKSADGKKFLSLEPAEVITGTMTALSNKGVATVDGQSVASFDGKSIDTDLVGKDVAAVMANGYAWSVTATGKAPATAGDNYIWVTNVWVETAGKYDKGNTAYAMGVLADGTIKTLKLGNPDEAGDVVVKSWDKMTDTLKTAQDTDKTDAGKPFFFNKETLGSLMAPAEAPAEEAEKVNGKFTAGLYYWYDGKANTDMAGKALLAACPAEAKSVKGGSSTGVSTSVAKIGSDYISANVSMVWINGAGDTLSASMTGRQAIANGKTFNYVLDENGRVAVIFLSADAVVSEDTIYVVKTGNRAAYTDKDGKTKSGYSVVSYKRGETESETIIATADVATGFYTAVANGEAFVLSGVTGDTVKVSVLATNMYNGFLTLDEEKVNLVNVKNADIIDLRGDDNVVSTVEELEELVTTNGKNTYVSLIAMGNTDAETAEAVYIMKTSETTTPVTPEENEEGKTEVEVPIENGSGSFEITPPSGNDGKDPGTEDNPIIITTPDGGESEEITDWGDVETTKGFLVMFEGGAGSQNGHTIKLTVKGSDEKDLTPNETGNPDEKSKGWLFYIDTSEYELGTYNWEITCTKGAQVDGKDTAGCGKLASGSFEILKAATPAQ